MEKEKHPLWELIGGKIHQELDEDESKLFQLEMKDEKNKILFKKAEKIHSGLGEIRNIHYSSKANSWKSIHGKIRFGQIKHYSIQFAKYAAILIFAYYLGFQTNSFYQWNGKMQYTDIEVLNGQMGHIFLCDGTEVWLNSGSHFKYPTQFNQKERDVYLDGEAYFHVTSNKKLPFKVKTNDMEVEVLGTSFNVSAYQDDIEQSVVLVEGNVQINKTSGEKIANLLPGQIAYKHENCSNLKIKKVSTNLYTTWKDGKVVFEAERLEEIAKKLERWYNVTINFENEKLKDYEFSGTILRNKPIDQVIMAFEMLAPLKFKYTIMASEKNQITIQKK